MKNSIGKTLICIVIAISLFTPLMGDTACADEVGCGWDFDDYDRSETWETNPENMCDGNPYTYASTTIDGDVQLLNSTDYDHEELEYDYPITAVWIRAWGYYTGNESTIILRPRHRGNDGRNMYFFTPGNGEQNNGSSDWYNITNDWGDLNWLWEDIANNLSCWVEAQGGPGGFTLYCSRVEILVWFIVP